MKTREDLLNEATAFLSGLKTDVDVDYYINDIEDVLDSSDAFDYILDVLNDNNAMDGEIIYYSNAMNFLREHDHSLQISLGIASEYGYTPENLNSEILASLLNSQMIREDFEELRDEINEYFEELKEKIEELEDED